MAKQENPTTPSKQSRTGIKGMHIAMIACCMFMLIPVFGLVMAGSGRNGSGLNLTTLAPLLLCVGAHLLMHKMLGKSCHGKDKDNVEEQEAGRSEASVSDVPLIKRT